MAATLIALQICGCSGGGDDSPPNIVIIIADDPGWNDVGAYGSAVAQTPNIDRLAKDGLRFTNMFLTSSSCSSSRASILTGRYAQTHDLVHLSQSLRGNKSPLSAYLKRPVTTPRRLANGTSAVPPNNTLMPS
ncbi:MAG: sulfatase-like hydrolase/transferase [Halioglobus sp.]|nr:sulfatase-like hydrolase/transferase [Halioglobus sp.]